MIWTRPRTWSALLRNVVPVVGVFVFGWSAEIVVVDYRLDGATSLVATMTAMLPGPIRDQLPADAPTGMRGALGVLGFLVIQGFVGAPFWFALAWIHSFVLTPQTWSAVLHDPLVLAGLLSVAATNVVEVARAGYGSMPEEERKRAVGWEYQLLLLRVAAMLVAAFLLPRGMVVALAVVLFWAETRPLQALRFFGAPFSPEDVPSRRQPR